MRALRMQNAKRIALGREGSRTSNELGLDLRKGPFTEAERLAQDHGFARLQRVDLLYKELHHLHWKRIILSLFVAIVIVGAILMVVHEGTTPFQLNGAFSSVLFRTTTDIELKREEGASYTRMAHRIMIDTTWEHRTDGPFNIRAPLDVISLDSIPIEFSHLSIPAGTVVRLQRDGNVWSMFLAPLPKRRTDLSLTLFKENGAMGQVEDTTAQFGDGLNLFAADAEWQLLRMADLHLEFPCVSIDSIRFVTTDHFNPADSKRSSVLAANLILTDNGTDLRLLQHDTLVMALDGPGIFCLKADRTGMGMTVTGEAVELLAGRAGADLGLLDRRRPFLAAWISSIPPDMRTFLLSVVLSILGYFIIEKRRT